MKNIHIPFFGIQKMQNNMQNMQKNNGTNMQNMQNNMWSQFQVYRKVTCAYSTFLLKICTPHFADGSNSPVGRAAARRPAQAREAKTPCAAPPAHAAARRHAAPTTLRIALQNHPSRRWLVQQRDVCAACGILLRGALPLLLHFQHGCRCPANVRGRSVNVRAHRSECLGPRRERDCEVWWIALWILYVFTFGILT